LLEQDVLELLFLSAFFDGKKCHKTLMKEMYIDYISKTFFFNFCIVILYIYCIPKSFQV